MSGDPYASWTDDELAGLEHGFRSDLYDGRVALVTGGAGGIGRAICMLLGKLGAQIITCGRDETKLRELEQSLGSHGIDVCSIPMTIRDPEGVAQLIAAAWDQCGGLDLVVNNAGGQFAAPAMEISPKGWAAVDGQPRSCQAPLQYVGPCADVADFDGFNARRIFADNPPGSAEVPTGVLVYLLLEVVHDPVFDFVGDVEGRFHKFAFVFDQPFLLRDHSDLGSWHDADANP